MTSYGPVDMTDEQRAKLVERGDMTPEQSAQAAAQRQQLVDLSNGAAPGYGTGKAVRAVGGKLIDALVNPMGIGPDGAPSAGAQAYDNGITDALANTGAFARNFAVSSLGLPDSWAYRRDQHPEPVSDTQARQLAPPGIAAPDPNAASVQQQSSQQLMPPRMAYGGRPSSGGGFGSIIKDEQQLQKDIRSNEQQQLGDIERNTAAAANAENELAAVKADTATQVAQVYNDEVRAQDIANGEQAQREQVARQTLQQEDQKLTAEAAENAKLVEDPNRYWHNKSTASKIGSGIAVMLGALGAGLTGGPNLALQGIEDAINKDIEAQRTNIHQKNQALATHQRMQADRRAAFNDDVNYFNLKKASAWDDVVKKAQAFDLSNQPAEIQAMAQKNIAQAQANADGLRAQVRDNTVGKVQQNLAAQAQAKNMQDNSAQGWASINVQRATALAKAQGKQLPDSVKAELAKIDAAQASLTSINKDKPGAVSSFFSKIAPWDTDADKYERESSNKITGVAKALSGEATNESDIKRNEANRPRATDSEKTAAQKTKVFNDQLNDRKRALLAQYGIEMPTTSLEGL